MLISCEKSNEKMFVKCGKRFSSTHGRSQFFPSVEFVGTCWDQGISALVEKSENPAYIGKSSEFSTGAEKTGFNNRKPLFFKASKFERWITEPFSTRFSTPLWKTVENLWEGGKFCPWAMLISGFFREFFKKSRATRVCNILIFTCIFVIFLIAHSKPVS